MLVDDTLPLADYKSRQNKLRFVNIAIFGSLFPITGEHEHVSPLAHAHGDIRVSRTAARGNGKTGRHVEYEYHLYTLAYRAPLPRQ